MKFEYPTKEINDENASRNLGSNNSFGFYPLSRFNSWHGGYHVEGQGLEIKAIADGKIIAYRIPTDYTEEKIGEEKSHYSNGFVLIQHEYKSPNNQELTFFSLYMHLLPKTQVMATGKRVPAVFTKRSGKLNGLNARHGKDKHVSFVIPEGEMVTIDTNLNDHDKSATHWSKGKDYKKVTFHDKNDTVWTDIYINTREKYVKKVGTNQYKVITKEDNDYVPENYSFSKNIELDKIVSCSISIKAGQLIGYSGQYGFEKQPNYTAAHIEVFTPDNVGPFITDAKKDGQTEKHYFKVKAGAILKKAYPDKIYGSGQVKVKQEEHFSEVQLHSLTGTVLRTDLDFFEKVEEITHYKPLTGEHLKRLNTAFHNFLTKDSILVYIATEGDKRKVSFALPATTKKYWIPTGNLPAGTEEIRNLDADLTEIYEEKPDPNKLQDTVEKEVIVPIKSFKKHKSPDGKIWYYLVADGKKGWIKEDDTNLEKISAYEWDKFGFKVLKDEDSEYLYDTKNPPKFLNDLWAQLDTDHNKVLSSSELRNAYNDPVLAKKLSHLVCYHRSEWAWGTEWNTFKAEVKELYREGIDKEEDAALKKKYETKRDLTLDALEARLKALCFWKEIKAVAEKKEEKKEEESIFSGILNPFSYFSSATATAPAPAAPVAAPKVFPVGDPKVYHFHPVAFVEQMRRLGGKCFCNRDFTEEEVKSIVIAMRKSESAVYVGNKKDELFFGYNCSLPQSDRNYKTFTEHLNSVCKEYKIDSCIRKIHFVAQTYWEADRYRTTTEYADGTGYNPGEHDDAENMENTIDGDGPKYRGRGLMQLTWRKNYRMYFEYLLANKKVKLEQYTKSGITSENLLNRSKDYHKLISDNLYFAVDSAGWFWSIGKKANYTSESKKNQFAEILNKSLNEVSDFGDKYVNEISRLVNGGGNGKAERFKYYEELRDNVFKVKSNCDNYDKIKS